MADDDAAENECRAWAPDASPEAALRAQAAAVGGLARVAGYLGVLCPPDYVCERRRQAEQARAAR
eukprot:929155-Lingulodinium_polyedra.AAC.1